jgi:tRNA modification GTPase
LAQAEAVSDLIDAQTQAAARGASRSLVGQFSHEVELLQSRLLHIRMLVEACLDFPEEDIDFVEKADVASQLSGIVSDTQRLGEQARQGALLRDGMKLVIAGQPNAGKSSLLNALTGQDTAIVTSIPGTTRDVLSQTISIQGVPVHVVDTAGLRDADCADEVEKIGMSRAWGQVADADVVLLVYDLSRMQEPDYVQAQTALKNQMMQKKGNNASLLHVFNKSDLVPGHEAPNGEGDAVYLSAKTTQGLDALKDFLLQSVGWKANFQEGVFSARDRHVQALEVVKRHTEKALQHLKHPPPALDLLAEELRCAQQHLSLLTGSMSADDLLGHIFSKFCIGK